METFGWSRYCEFQTKLHILSPWEILYCKHNLIYYLSFQYQSRQHQCLCVPKQKHVHPGVHKCVYASSTVPHQLSGPRVSAGQPAHCACLIRPPWWLLNFDLKQERLEGREEEGEFINNTAKHWKEEYIFGALAGIQAENGPIPVSTWSQNDIFMHDPSILWLLVMTWQITFSNKGNCSNHLCGFFLPPLLVWFFSRWERLFYNRLDHS